MAESYTSTYAADGTAVDAALQRADTAVQPGDIDDNPVDGATAAPISSNWAATKALASDPTGITGASRVTNVVSLTQSSYDALTPDATTLYVITD